MVDLQGAYNKFHTFMLSCNLYRSFKTSGSSISISSSSST